MYVRPHSRILLLFHNQQKADPLWIYVLPQDRDDSIHMEYEPPNQPRGTCKESTPNIDCYRPTYIEGLVLT